jgi:colicin import membrane protein
MFFLASGAVAQTTENAQFKALREQLEREAAAQKAVIQADIERNPNGKNAQEARKAAEAEKAAAEEKRAAEEKTKVDQTEAAKAAGVKEAAERKEAEAQWAAGAAQREHAVAAKKAAIDQWRASGKSGPSIIMGKRANGTVTVMVDGKVSSFSSAAEADAFVEKIRRNAETTLSY